MLKSLTLLTLPALAAVFCATAAAAQTPSAQTPAAPASHWVVVSPEGEGFTARMPHPPTPSEQSVITPETEASGRRYSASSEDGTDFAVWVMKGWRGDTPLIAPIQRASFSGGDFYLDAVAELAWELLITPEMQRIKLEGAARRPAEIVVGMSYAREFELGGRRAREYSVRLEKARGTVYVYADERRSYVVAALGAGADNARLKQFLDSFAPEGVAGPRAPGGVAGTSEGGGSGAGAAAADTAVGGGPADEAGVDYTRPFHYDDVTKRAIITAKPEPGFTEEARKFNVTGVVRLRAILSASGKVQAIIIVKGLPHGLTRKALTAAQGVRFEPAQKDGRVVSQFVTFEYNFNIY